MTKRRNPPPPPTELERSQAAEAAAAIRRSIADPAAAGEARAAHILLARPRRGMWLRTWANLPGLCLDVGRNLRAHVAPRLGVLTSGNADRDDRRSRAARDDGRTADGSDLVMIS